MMNDEDHCFPFSIKKMQEDWERNRKELERLRKERPEDQKPSKDPATYLFEENPLEAVKKRESCQILNVPVVKARYMFVSGPQNFWTGRMAPILKVLRVLQEDKYKHVSFPAYGFFWRFVKSDVHENLKFVYEIGWGRSLQFITSEYVFYWDVPFAIAGCVFQKTGRRTQITDFSS